MDKPILVATEVHQSLLIKIEKRGWGVSKYNQGMNKIQIYLSVLPLE